MEVLEFITEDQFLGVIEIDDTTKAWIAGFFDGEGCVLATVDERKDRGTPLFKCRVTLVNTNLDVLKYIQSLYGGSIALLNRSDHVNKLCYQWYLAGRVSERFVKDILPYSRVKADQLVVFLEARSMLVKDKNVTSEMVENRRGLAARLKELR